MGDVFSAICYSPSDLGLWSKCLMLPQCILTSSARGGGIHWCKTVKHVKHHIYKKVKDWKHHRTEHGNITEQSMMENSCPTACLSRKRKNIAPELIGKANIIRAQRPVENGQYCKAIQAPCSQGFVPVFPRMLNEMQVKFSQVPSPPIPSTLTSTYPANISNFEVFKATRLFPNVAATGPSSLRASHLKEVMQ